MKAAKHVSSLKSCTFSSSSNDEKNKVLSKIDPLKGNFDNFLQNVQTYEESLDDNLNPFFLKSGVIDGFATQQGKFAELDISKNNILQQ